MKVFCGSTKATRSRRRRRHSGGQSEAALGKMGASRVPFSLRVPKKQRRKILLVACSVFRFFMFVHSVFHADSSVFLFIAVPYSDAAGLRGFFVVQGHGHLWYSSTYVRDSIVQTRTLNFINMGLLRRW